MTRGLAALLCGLIALPAWGQKPPRDPEVVKKSEEDDWVGNAVERLTKPQDTERMRFLKEIAKLRPADANEAVKGEVDLIFDRLASGAEAWTYEVARQRGVRDLFERVASRLNLAEGFVSRAQFQTYAANYLRPESSPPWRTPADDEERAFRYLDRNRDGVVDAAEATSTLREANADSNRDGVFDRSEYAAYFGQRVQARLRKIEEIRQAREAKEAAKQGLAPSPPPTVAARPTATKTEVIEAIRFGHLPKGLPEWFASLDSDRDGQVGLYEWHRAGRDLEDFEALDANGDGLVTSDEWVRFSQAHPDEVARYIPPPAASGRGMSPVSLKMR